FAIGDPPAVFSADRRYNRPVRSRTHAATRSATVRTGKSLMSRSPAAPNHRVYCAGPLVNGAEREEMTAIADELVAAGYLVYLPHRDGMEFRLVHEVLVERGWDAATAAHFLHASIFALDIHQLVV